MTKNKTEFTSISELSKHIGVSRKTLYSRSKRHNIPLNGVYSDSDLSLLSNQKSVTPDTESKQKGNTPKVTLGNSSDKLNTQLITQLQDQISDLKSDKKNLQKELSSKDSHLKTVTNLLDQSQQLQLDLQHQLAQNEKNKTQLLIENKNLQDELTHEKDKNFWKRLFNV